MPPTRGTCALLREQEIDHPFWLMLIVRLVLSPKAKRPAALLRPVVSQGLVFLLQTENVARIIHCGRLETAGHPPPL